MEPWKHLLDNKTKEIVGETKVQLLNSDCTSRECNAGNFFADAAVFAFTKLTPFNKTFWTQASIALINTGSIRVPLHKGNLTYGHLANMSPFENKLTAFTLQGIHLIEALEFSINEIDIQNNKFTSSIFLQISGMKVTYNITRPYGERLISLKVLCQNCVIPEYHPVDVKNVYRIITSDFLAQGGGGFKMFREYGQNFQKELTDLDAICDYVKDTSPITTGLEGRINVVY